jgi:ubiquinone/menaquinone biosynthesis C-methylase UbiE
MAKPRSVDWSRYAEVYDLILTYNVAYQDIVADFEAVISRWELAPGQVLLDVGAGTGNFGLRLAERFPQTEVLLLDHDAIMLEQAQCKAKSKGLGNVRFLRGDAARPDELVPLESVSAVVAVHSLYTLTDPLAALRALRSVCQLGARAYFCDLGRVMRLMDWAWYLLRETTARHGPVQAMRTFWHGRIIGRENRRIAAQQRNGLYWLHSADQFKAAIESAGFLVEEERKLFRGYSDRVEATTTAVPTTQLMPLENHISAIVRLFARGRAEGVAVLETIGTQRLTICTADALYLDFRPTRKLQLCLANAWSDPLVVVSSSKSTQDDRTVLAVALPRKAGKSFLRRLAIESLARGSTLGNLKLLGLPVPNLAGEVEVRRARPAELNYIVDLRTLAYRYDGKHSAPTTFTDELDEHAVHLCGFFCGRPVAALRLMLPTEEHLSEHQRLIKWPAEFPPTMELADISRVCVHPEFRHCRILEALFQRTAAEIMRFGRSWLVGSAATKLLPMYRRIGCIPTRITWDDPQLFGGVSHTVFLCDVRSALLGKTNPLIWLFLWRNVARALLQDGIITPRTPLEQMRLKLMLGLALVFDSFVEEGGRGEGRVVFE